MQVTDCQWELPRGGEYKTQVQNGEEQCLEEIFFILRPLKVFIIHRQIVIFRKGIQYMPKTM